MKRILFFALSLSVIVFHGLFAKTCVSADSCDTEINSRSYLALRPHFQSASPEMVSSFRDDRTDAREDGLNAALQFVLFGSRSTDSDDLARYFMPFGKNSLLITEDFSVFGAEENTDLLAQHFNIFTVNKNFSSRIKLKPKVSVIGLGMFFRKSFWRNEEKGRGWWASVSSPLTRVRTEVELSEDILSRGGGPDEGADEAVVGTMKEAFAQKEWKYGKICKGTMSDTKLGDIECKVGYEWLDHEPYHLESYIGALIPTGTRPEGKFIFEPVVGCGRHAGIMLGNAAGIQIWSNQEEEKTVRMEMASHSNFLFSKTQVRSFDLKNKPWSRYMEVYENKEQATAASTLVAPEGITYDPKVTLATPGINVFTQKVDVKPGFSINTNSAFVYTRKGFQAELGYNFFGRRAECVKLARSWKEGPALKHAEGNGQTNPIRDITGNFFLEEVEVDEVSGTLPVPLLNYEKSIIKEEQLDLQSAATPCLLSHTVYGTLGYHCEKRTYPTVLNCGGAYTFSQSNNAVVKKWTLWGKLGFSF